jgi:hypothetical protein
MLHKYARHPLMAPTTANHQSHAALFLKQYKQTNRPPITPKPNYSEANSETNTASLSHWPLIQHARTHRCNGYHTVTTTSHNFPPVPPRTLLSTEMKTPASFARGFNPGPQARSVSKDKTQTAIDSYAKVVKKKPSAIVSAEKNIANKKPSPLAAASLPNPTKRHKLTGSSSSPNNPKPSFPSSPVKKSLLHPNQPSNKRSQINSPPRPNDSTLQSVNAFLLHHPTLPPLPHRPPKSPGPRSLPSLPPSPLPSISPPLTPRTC